MVRRGDLQETTRLIGEATSIHNDQHVKIQLLAKFKKICIVGSEPF